MSLGHIYLSHAGEDGSVATELAEHLRNAGHDTCVDTLDLSLGDNVIRFMNEGLAGAHTVVILFSRWIDGAKWQQLEIDSAVWNEFAQGGGRCLVVRLDDTPLPPLLGPRVYGYLRPGDATSLEALVRAICEQAAESPSATSVVAQALRRQSNNPFRYLRAEFFENRPDLHAKAFASPDALTVGALQDMKPSFLEGSRGTGKSMLLLSVRARNYLQEKAATAQSPKLFGFYLKLTRGAICNAGIGNSTIEPVEGLGHEAAQLTDLASQELILQMLESLFSELSYCIDYSLVACERHSEIQLARSAHRLLFGQTGDVSSLQDLLDDLAATHKELAGFIRRRFIYGESVSVPVATFDIELLKRVLQLIRRHLASLADTMFIVLLDEFENLFNYQQRIVNGFVKLGPPSLSVKIAKKLGAGDTAGTLVGQELQETHDYSRISLVYDVEDPTQRARYADLLRHIVTNICASEGLGEVNAATLLPRDKSEEVEEERLVNEVAQLLKISPAAFRALPEKEQGDKWTYYHEAAVYRVLLGSKGRHKSKRFSGFGELTFLSSGVIRYFQEILGVAYHLTFGSEALADAPLVLPAASQSEAVHFVSQHNLTTLSRNVERYGEDLKYFLLDLGDCLRHKLLKHTSEPESARLTIEDPELLGSAEMLPLRRLLEIGIREGVFQTKEGLPAFKPKHSSDPQPAEFNISRIYAPVLEISPRLRWRTTVTCRSLLSLLEPGKRAKGMQDLKGLLVRRSQPNAEQMVLLSREQ